MSGYLWVDMWLLLCEWLEGHYVELYNGQWGLAQIVF
jgi:hypothetical protein